MDSVTAKVLAFYKELPFNDTSSVSDAVEELVSYNAVEYIYPSPEDFSAAENILEMGCGVGWFCNSVAYYYNKHVTAVDINPTAIAKAKEVSEFLGTDVDFVCSDLFEFNAPGQDIVISNGVLHHTKTPGGGGSTLY